MYSPFKLARKYLQYYLTASNGKGHGIHSPFIFDFVKNVLNDKKKYYAYKSIEQTRQQMLRDHTVLSVNDMGAGSTVSKTSQRKISEIARSALKPKKFGQLLFRIVNRYQPKTIVELGTSLGITTAYLASAKSDAKVVTIEGSGAVADVALMNLARLGLTNVELVRGNFDDKLQWELWPLGKVDLAFIDGNHRKEPTIRYFEQIMRFRGRDTILIFDDIHWSREMEQAWEYIRWHPSVTGTVDLFFVGIVFFRPEFKSRQHFTIRF